MQQKKLSQFEKGEKIEILNINCKKEFAKRLCALGFFEGTETEIIKNDNIYPIILQVLNSKIALGQKEANEIYGKKI